MNSNSSEKYSQNRFSEAEMAERDSNRWLIVFYDSVLYLFCWIMFFVAHISVKRPFPLGTTIFYLVLGALVFFGIHFLMKCYRLIWRYGSSRAISREFFASFSGLALFLIVGLFFTRVLHLFEIRFVIMISFGASFLVGSFAARIAYFNLYRFAERDTLISPLLRRLFEVILLVDFTSQKPGAVLSAPFEHSTSSDSPINELQHIADQFAIRGTIQSIKQIKTGYINRTYHLKTLSEAGHIHQYTLQRINTNVFCDADRLMANYKLTTEHLAQKLVMPGEHQRGKVPTIRPTRDGKLYFKDDSGHWRVLTYFDGVYSMDIPKSPEVFYYAGVAFGSFLKAMSDVDTDQIHEVIPNFHNTPSRYRDLENAVMRNAKCRAEDVEKEIAFVRARASCFGVISSALESGIIPKRICHNDTNLNNILFDKKTDLPVAIIDLDTVMASSPLYDFGDSMRIGTNTAKDDEKDLSKVSCDLNLYEQYARGYLEACGSILTEDELSLLPYAALVITAEDGIRFLTDHINGDVYYNIFYPGQNLDRARTQLRLLEDMEQKLDRIKEILRRIYEDLGLRADVNKYRLEEELKQ